MKKINLHTVSERYASFKRLSEIHPKQRTTFQNEMIVKYRNELDKIFENLPSGSGIDDGTKFDFHNSQPQKLIFTTAFHHMTNGSYNGWTHHKITITPKFGGFDIKIAGEDRNDVKQHLYFVFEEAFEV